jgi:hypothetical protein
LATGEKMLEETLEKTLEKTLGTAGLFSTRGVPNA